MASRKEEKQQRKAERLARQQAAETADRRRRLIGYGVGGLLVVAVVAAIVVVLASGGDKPPNTKGLRHAAAAAGCVVRSLPDEGNGHSAGPWRYKSNPPTSGTHNPVPANDSAYIKAPIIGALVHALEHGRIIIQYSASASPQVRDGLKRLYDESSTHVLLTPNTTRMPYEVAATAWTHLLGCRRVLNQAKVFSAVRAFRDAYRDHGPETVP